MTPDRGPISPDINFDKDLLEKIFYHSDFRKKLIRGISTLKKVEQEETAFGVASTLVREIFLSAVKEGSTKITYKGKTLDDYFKNGYIKSSSVNAGAFLYPTTEPITEIAFFHFHPDGDNRPSYEDINVAVGKIYNFPRANSGKAQIHKRLVSGIFAVKDVSLFEGKSPAGSLDCLMYGLGNKGLVSNYYQQYDSIESASSYKEALSRSGFWLVEGQVELRSNKQVVWSREFIDEVAKNLES